MLLQRALSNEYFLNEWINEQIYSIGDKAFFFFLGECRWCCGWEHRIQIRVWYMSNIILCFHLLAFMPLYNQSSWDGWMASPTQWTWVWVNSGSWWWTGRPGVLQSMGHREPDMTEQLNWTSLAYELTLLLIIIIQEEWWNEVAEEQLRLACSPWLFLLLALMEQLQCCELPYGRACVGKSWERLPAHSQAGGTPATVTWRSLKAAPSPLSFEMKAALANIFFFFNLFFKVDLLFFHFYSVWVFFFFSSAAQHAKCQFSNQEPKPWPLQWKLGDPATGLKGSLSSWHLAAGSWKTGATGPRPPVPPFLTQRSCEMMCCCFRPLSFRATCYTAVCN